MTERSLALGCRSKKRNGTILGTPRYHCSDSIDLLGVLVGDLPGDFASLEMQYRRLGGGRSERLTYGKCITEMCTNKILGGERSAVQRVAA